MHEQRWRPVCVCLLQAGPRKRATYPEVVSGERRTLLTAASEVGGRLSVEVRRLIKAAAGARPRSEANLLRAAVGRGLRARWSIVSVAVQAFVAATLVDDVARAMDSADGTAPIMVHWWSGAPL